MGAEDHHVLAAGALGVLLAPGVDLEQFADEPVVAHAGQHHRQQAIAQARASALGWDPNADMFMRDGTISDYLPPLPYGEEMWDLYSRNALTPDTRLTGNDMKAAAKAKLRQDLAKLKGTIAGMKAKLG